MISSGLASMRSGQSRPGRPLRFDRALLLRVLKRNLVVDTLGLAALFAHLAKGLHADRQSTRGHRLTLPYRTAPRNQEPLAR